MSEAILTALLCCGCGLAVWGVYRLGVWIDARLFGTEER